MRQIINIFFFLLFAALFLFALFIRVDLKLSDLKVSYKDPISGSFIEQSLPLKTTNSDKELDLTIQFHSLIKPPSLISAVSTGCIDTIEVNGTIYPYSTDSNCKLNPVLIDVRTSLTSGHNVLLLKIKEYNKQKIEFNLAPAANDLFIRFCDILIMFAFFSATFFCYLVIKSKDKIITHWLPLSAGFIVIYLINPIHNNKLSTDLIIDPKIELESQNEAKKINYPLKEILDKSVNQVAKDLNIQTDLSYNTEYLLDICLGLITLIIAFSISGILYPAQLHATGRAFFNLLIAIQLPFNAYHSGLDSPTISIFLLVSIFLMLLRWWEFPENIKNWFILSLLIALSFLADISFIQIVPSILLCLLLNFRVSFIEKLGFATLFLIIVTLLSGWHILPVIHNFLSQDTFKNFSWPSLACLLPSYLIKIEQPHNIISLFNQSIILTSLIYLIISIYGLIKVTTRGEYFLLPNLLLLLTIIISAIFCCGLLNSSSIYMITFLIPTMLYFFAHLTLKSKNWISLVARTVAAIYCVNVILVLFLKSVFISTI